MHNHSVSTEKQLTTLPLQRRATKVELKGYDPETRTVEFALSSEEPVERYYGKEVLDHSSDAIDQSRLKRGVPLLYNHDPNQHIGLIDSHRIEGGKLIVRAKFGNSALAKEKEQDVKDGILRDASVGYKPMEYKRDAGDKSGDTYRWTRWMPLEGSLCPIPADPTVGIRGETAGEQYPVRCLDVSEPAQELPKVDESRHEVVIPAKAEPNAEVKRMSEENKVGIDAAKAERERVSEIHAIERQYPKILTRDQAEKFVGEGSGVDQVRKFILDEQIKAGKENEVRNLNRADLSDKEKKQYSVTAALRKLSGDANGSEGGFEEEVSNTLAKKLGKAARGNGFYIPMDIPMRAGDLDRARAMRSGAGVQTRAGLDTNSTANGEFTVFTEYVSLIELLRNQLVVRKLGATMLSGLSDNIAFPKQATAGSAYWVADNPGVDVADSNLTFAQITMSPKLLQSSTSFSRKLLLQSSVDVEALVRQDLMAVMALAIDLAALAGTGVNNQPLGILNQTGIGSYVTGGNSLSAAVNGSNYGFDMLNELETQIAEANADALGAAAYLTTPRVRKKLKVTPEMGNTIALPIWQGSEANGYRAEVSNQVPKVETGGGTPYLAHSLIYGIWNQLIIGEWGALEVITDPYRLKKQGMIEVTTFDTCDVNVRHPQAFGAATDINPLI